MAAAFRKPLVLPGNSQKNASDPRMRMWSRNPISSSGLIARILFRTKNSRKLVESGIKRLQERDLPGARKAFEEAAEAEKHPRFTCTLYLRAAGIALEEALRVGAEAGDSLLLETAEVCCTAAERAKRDFPEGAAALFRKAAHLQIAARRYCLAQSSYSKAIASTKRWETPSRLHESVGDLHFRRQEFFDALDRYLQAGVYSLDAPDSRRGEICESAAYACLGRAQVEEGRKEILLDSAASMFVSAAELLEQTDPDKAGLLRSQAEKIRRGAKGIERTQWPTASQ